MQRRYTRRNISSQFPISVNLEKVRKLVEGPCPIVLLKADTGADVNFLNSTTFDRIIGNRSILQPSTYKMEAYRNSTVDVLWKFLHIPQMERQDLQAIILHDNSQCITQPTFQRWLLHPRSAETMLVRWKL